jgi:hypothetical protein
VALSQSRGIFLFCKRHNHLMGVIDSILENPSTWTGERVLDELPVRINDDPRRDDPSLPRWLREVIVLCDFDTHIQMEGLLGWWENAATNDLGNVMEAFHAVGLSGQSELLGIAREVLDPRALDSDPSQIPYSVSNFADRRKWVTEKQYTRLAQIEEQFYLNTEKPSDLYAALVAHADAGLAATLQPRRP